MFKKILLVFLLVFALVSCWDDSSWEASSWSTLDLHETEDFSVFIPSNWEVISDKSNIIPKPSTWDIALAVTKNTVSGFSNNLLILSEELSSDISSWDYSLSNNVWSKKEYYQYNLLQEKNIVFWENNVSKLYIFEARYGENTPMSNFLQTAVVCPDNTWYVLTIGLTSQETSFLKYENILKSFECKN